MATTTHTSASPPHNHSGVSSPVSGGRGAGCGPGMGVGAGVGVDVGVGVGFAP